MELRWLEDALADITEIHRYIAADDPRAAARVVARIQAAIRSLTEVPHRGRPGRWPATRELIIPGTPYIVPYRVQGELVEILRVFHGARRWPEEPVDDRGA
jgi:toxin ParE1/3/4